MKQIIDKVVLLLLVLMLGACEKKVEKEAVDIEGSKAEVAAVLDKFHSSLKSKNAGQMNELLVEEGLFSGTDPTELWDKKTYINYMNKIFADTTLGVVEYDIDKRLIHVDKSGVSGYILEQFEMEKLSPNVPWRMITHLVKEDNTWKIDLISYNLTPTNEQMPAIIKAVN